MKSKKTPFSNEISDEEIITCDNDKHREKAYDSITITGEDIVICVNDEQPLKELYPIEVTKEGIDICVKFLHPEKAPFPIIKVCLAVDALYFKADFKITIDDCVSGFLLKDEKDLLLLNGSFKHFTKCPSSFQTFLNLNWQKNIKSGFVFQIQPYKSKNNLFIVHIFPSSNGYSSCEIIIYYLYEKLTMIKSKYFIFHFLQHYTQTIIPIFC